MGHGTFYSKFAGYFSNLDFNIHVIKFFSTNDDLRKIIDCQSFKNSQKISKMEFKLSCKPTVYRLHIIFGNCYKN